MRRTSGGFVVAAFVSLSFVVACGEATQPPAPGRIEITAITLGDDPDADGYVVRVGSDPTPYVLGAKGSITISSVVAGSHEVRLEGTATNCAVEGGAARRVSVTAGQRVVVAFSITCVPRVGSIAVSTVTTGFDLQTGGYRVTVDATVGRSVGANDTTTLAGIREGVRNVWLRDLAANCTVAGSNPRLVTVSLGETATAAFAVTCVSMRGTIQITTVTTGPDPDTDGYTARVVWGRETTSTLVPSRGTASIEVVAGDDYLISLLGVAENCSVEQQGWQGSTRRVDLAPGATVAVSFAVMCESVSDTRLPPGGQLVFVRGGRIYRVNSDGTGLVKLTDGPSDAQPAWSPDGRRIAFHRSVESAVASDIYTMDADGSNVIRRTRDGNSFEPSWSPDGKRIAFGCLPGTGSAEVCVISADDDGSGPTAITDRCCYEGEPAWSPDGTRVALVSDWAFYDFASDIFVVSPEGGSVTQLTDGFQLSSGAVGFYAPAWSPDGRKLAVIRCPYAYDTCAASNLVVMNADGSGSETLTATRAAYNPTWSPDGRTIAFATRFGIEWTRADGSERGIIVADGYQPAWRP